MHANKDLQSIYFSCNGPVEMYLFFSKIFFIKLSRCNYHIYQNRNDVLLIFRNLMEGYCNFVNFEISYTIGE